MYFRFIFTLSEEVKKQVSFIDKISDYLEISLKDKYYGNGVIKALFGINCVGPLGPLWRDFETGTIIHKKYAKSKGLLDITLKLKFTNVKSADNDQLIEIVKNGILETYSEVSLLKINDFNINGFYGDLKNLLSDKEWLNHPEKYKRPPVNLNLKDDLKDFPRELTLTEDDFWQYICESIEKNQGPVENQLNFLIKKLASEVEEKIVDFELILRKIIKKGYDYNVIGLLKVIDGNVSDDQLLYFRCNLILLGREMFYNILRTPNMLTEKIKIFNFAELLLSVPDNAFRLKYGENTDKEVPSEIGAQFINYNDENYEITGVPWTDKDYPMRFARILSLYNKK